MTDILRINEWSTVRLRGDGRISIGDGLHAVSIVENEASTLLIKLLCEGNRTLDSICQTVSTREGAVSPEEVSRAVESLRNAGVVEVLPKGRPSAQQKDEDPRYARQKLYWKALGSSEAEAQSALTKLSEAKVLVLGCGGMGAMTALNLVIAGVRRIHVVDADDVESSNLNRSFLFTESDVGCPKTRVVREKLGSFRKDVEITGEEANISSSGQVAAIIEALHPDYMVLAADKPYLKINLWANDAAIEAGVPYSSAGVAEDYGSVGPLVVPGSTSCFRCQGFDMHDIADAPDAVREHNDRRCAPSFGPLIASTAALHANQIVQYLSESETPVITEQQIRINFSTMELEHLDRSSTGRCLTCNQGGVLR